MRYINEDNVSPTGDGGGILDTGGLSRNPQGKKEEDKEKRKEKKQCAGHSALPKFKVSGPLPAHTPQGPSHLYEGSNRPGEDVPI